MRAPPLLLLLFVPAALGCAGTVSSAAPGGDAEATTTIALVIVQRTVDATSARAQSSARFVRFAPSLSPDDALRAIGAAIDLPPIDTCASSAPVPAEATTDESPPVVELVDMGEVSLDADGASTRLVPRLLPDVTDVVSGVVYARSGELALLPPALPYVIRAAGRPGLLSFEAPVVAPSDPTDVRVTGEDAQGAIAVTGGPLEITWPPDGTTDRIYVDVQPAGVRCSLGDGTGAPREGRATLPASLLGDSGTLSLHRLRRQPLHPLGLAGGEVRFDFARSLPYVRQ